MLHITTKRMHGCNCSGKSSPSMKKSMAQGDSPKEVSRVNKMNGRLLLFSSSKMTHYFKKWTSPGGVLKKYISFLQKFDPSNRSYIQQLFPKTTVPQKKIKTISTLKEQLFRESSCSESHPCKCKCLQLLLFEKIYCF